MAKKNRGPRPPVVNVSSTTTVEVSGGISSSEFKQLLDLQSASLGELTSIKSLMELSKQVQHAEAVKPAGMDIPGVIKPADIKPAAVENNPDLKVIGEKVKVEKEELDVKKEQLKIDKESLVTSKRLQELRDDEAEAISNIAKSVKTFKSFGDRLEEMKKKWTDLKSPGGLKLGAMKALNVGGIFKNKIADEEFVQTQMKLGTNKSREQLVKEAPMAREKAKEIKKHEEKIKEFQQITGVSTSDLGKYKGGRDLLDQRAKLADEYKPMDERAKMIERTDAPKFAQMATTANAKPTAQPASQASKVAETSQKAPMTTTANAKPTAQPTAQPALQASKVAEASQKAPMTSLAASDLQKSPTQQFADQGVSKEQAIEDARLMGEQTALLSKIETNTRGNSPEQKAKPAEEKGGGGLLGGLLGGGKGGAMLKGLKDFGIGIVLIAGSLFIAAKAFQGFSKVEWGGVMKGMVALGAMVVAAVALSKASKSLKEVGVGLIAMSAALFITAKALEEFGNVNWSDIGKGLIALGGLVIAAIALDKVKGQIIMGGLALGVLALSLYGISQAFQTFGDLSWESIGKGMAAVAGIGVIGAIAGTAAPLLIAGGAALGVLGAGLYIVGQAMQAVGEGFDKMTAGMEKLAQLDGGNLLAVAAGLAALGPAMAVFAAGSVVAGIGNLVTGFLTAVSGQKSPIDQLKEIGNAGEGINKAGSGMQRLGSGMKAFSEVKPETMKQLNDFPWEKVTKFVAAGGSMQADSAKVYNASKQNADEQAKQEGTKTAGNTTVVNAPVNNNTTQNQMIKSPIRNQESTQSRYIGGRFATF
jgi:hypothetical protein